MVQKLSHLLVALTGEIHHRPILGLLGVLVLLVHLSVVLLLLQPTGQEKLAKPIKIMEVALVKEPTPKTEDTPPAPPKTTPPKVVPPKKKAVVPSPVKKKTPPKPVEQPKLKPQKVGDEQISMPTQPSFSKPPSASPSVAVSKPANKSGNGEAKSKGVNSGVVELGCPKPKYPNRAMSRHIEGSVKIALTISATGTVTNASVASAQPVGIFDDVALEAAKRCKFKPKMVNGNPVQLTTSKSFRFSLEN